MPLLKYKQQFAAAQSRTSFWQAYRVWVGGVVDSDTGERVFYASCSCPGYYFRGSCAHSTAAVQSAPAKDWEVEAE